MAEGTQLLMLSSRDGKEPEEVMRLLEGLAEVRQRRWWRCCYDAGRATVAGCQEQRRRIGLRRGRRRVMRRWVLGSNGGGRRRGSESGRPGSGGGPCLAVVRLLGVSHQVVLAAELLRAELALEVALARVHH